MVVSNGEMEALAATKWLEATMGDERERKQRERDGCRRNEEEGRAVRILACDLNITDGFSIGKMLTKRIVSLIYFTGRLKKCLARILLFKYQRI